MGKLDEAVENGCIESLLDYGHSFTPTYSPISLPTTTSGPTIGSIFVDYQYSWFYPKTYKEETINSLIRVFTEKLLQVQLLVDIMNLNVTMLMTYNSSQASIVDLIL